MNELELTQRYLEINNTVDIAKEITKKNWKAQLVTENLNLNKTDVLLDFGAGVGHMSLTFLTCVKKLYLCDVIEDMMDEWNNLQYSKGDSEYSIIPPGEMSYYVGKDINKVVAMEVFCDFDFYEVALCLSDMHEILPVGGELLFDFVNDAKIEIESEWFQNNISRQPHSVAGIENLAKQLGFKSRIVNDRDDLYPWMILEKL